MGMGKHENGYDRVDRDFYPTPSWAVDALAEHVELQNRKIWECAAGDGRMANALATHGARVFSSDVEPHDRLDAAFDFLSFGLPSGLERFDLAITNPPWGEKHRLAVAFIEAGLRRISEYGGLLGLLLPVDFDCAVTRTELFHSPFFRGRIVLCARPVWFERTDGKRAAPKENVAWFWWERPALRFPPPPLVLYAQSRPPKRRGHYDAEADVRASVLEGFRAIRERKAAGGPGWIAGGDLNRIVTIRRGGQTEEWLTIHPNGHIEHTRRDREARDQWVDLEHVKNYWPEVISQVEAALAELGAI
jgi:hypothetical protein